jgi:hypothetical protein
MLGWHSGAFIRRLSASYILRYGLATSYLCCLTNVVTCVTNTSLVGALCWKVGWRFHGGERSSSSGCVMGR